MTFNPQFENEVKEDNTSIDEHEKQESLWRYLLKMSSNFFGCTQIHGNQWYPIMITYFKIFLKYLKNISFGNWKNSLEKIYD
jgi:hypothetical protein